jgi:hypothetical protein
MRQTRALPACFAAKIRETSYQLLVFNPWSLNQTS